MRNGAGESNRKLAVVIMAAGKGTRLKSQRPKVLHEIGGQPLVAHVIAAARQIAEPDDIYVVIGHQAEKVRSAVASTGVRFVEQREQLGTGHAIQCARSAIEDYENVLVLSGDVPLIRPETLERLWNFHRTEEAAMTILTAAVEDPSGYGRIVRRGPDSPEVEAIVEQKALTAGQESLREINSGIYAFQTAPLLVHLDRLSADNANREVILTDMAGLLRAAGERVVAIQAEAAGEAAEVLGANTIAELVALDRTLRMRTAELAADAVIEPFVQLLGRTKIGSGSLIRSYTVIEDCTLGEGVLIRQSSVLSGSTVADGAKIGPFAHLRPGSEIGEDVHIGNFVETKKTKLCKGAKAGHLTYLGDAVVGEGTNIGAGTITCNYDGVNKHVTRIGKDAFVGSDSTLVAPVTVGDGAYLGAGSCITSDVPANALALGRARQIVKEGWAAEQRAGRKKK